MYDIYHTAERVLIWLGESDEDTEETTDFLWDTEDNRLNREKPLPGLVKSIIVRGSLAFGSSRKIMRLRYLHLYYVETCVSHGKQSTQH